MFRLNTIYDSSYLRLESGTQKSTSSHAMTF